MLVLGVGGLLGEAWMTGFLAGMEQRTGVDLRHADAYVGTSAGSIVAATLAAGVSPRRPHQADAAPAHGPATRRLDVALRRARRSSLEAAYPFASLAIDAAEPAIALARAAFLTTLPRGSGSLEQLRRHISELGCEFDGRLRIVAVDQASGKRVIFGAPGAPSAAVEDAVAASCAVPSIYPPVPIGSRHYVDGGVWSPSNLDAVDIDNGDKVLCLLPTGVMSRSRRTAVRGLGAALHSRTALELAGARRRGATVQVITPDAHAARAMGQNLLDSSRAPVALREGFRQGTAPPARVPSPEAPSPGT